MKTFCEQKQSVEDLVEAILPLEMKEMSLKSSVAFINKKTLGTPIAIVVRNQDARSEDYQDMPLRRGHADDLWNKKYKNWDPRGGGRSSGRETLSRVLAGSVAQMVLHQIYPELKVVAFSSQNPHHPTLSPCKAKIVGG